MKIFGLSITRAEPEVKEVSIDINTLVQRLEAVYETFSGVSITPENCEQAPTVKAVITAITNRFAVTPPQVLQKTVDSEGKAKKEVLPNHPVARLLSKPNEWQTWQDFIRDSTSAYKRYGNSFSFKSRGVTGPIRAITALDPSLTVAEQDEDYSVTVKTRQKSGGFRELPYSQVLHFRETSRDGVMGRSPIMDIREAIAMEIAAEKFGASFFGNGALPGIVFKYVEGSMGFAKDEERRAFLEDFQARYTKQGRFRAILPPKGIELGTPIPVENDKAQFLELRQHQRTVIAGALGVPPHLVGDLSKGTYNNVEQQDTNFTINVILPIARVYEAAMERDLLTVDDRRSGVIVRFNLDAVMRGDFKSRQEGLNVMRQGGAINANEWREFEGLNPRSDPGGDEYYQQGPSGQTGSPTGAGDPQTGREDDEPQDD